MFRSLSFASFLLLILGGVAVAQKGVDPQTQKIKDEGNKVTSRPNDVSHEIDWGKGKTKVRERLPNPTKLTARRDALITAVLDVLREQKIIVDDASSRKKDGLIVTQPFVFAKGLITQNEINRYAILDSKDTVWTRAQFTLTIEVQSIDGIQNNVSVNAKVEGRSNAGLMAEWVTVRSSGVAEDDFLSKLIEAVTGTSPEPTQDTDH